MLIELTGQLIEDRVRLRRGSRVGALDHTEYAGEAIQYLTPIPTNGRRVAVDNYGDKPVLWVGAMLEATVMKVEPLE